MGSSTSRPRKGHKNPKHLPKVGTPENMAWRHEGEVRDAFGGPWLRVVIGVVVVLALVGLLLINL